MLLLILLTNILTMIGNTDDNDNNNNNNNHTNGNRSHFGSRLQRLAQDAPKAEAPRRAPGRCGARAGARRGAPGRLGTKARAKARQVSEVKLPLGGGATWVARRSHTVRYGPDGGLRCDAILVKKQPGRGGKTPSIFASIGKGGRHWLKVKAAGKNWFWHSLVAWAFSNPDSVSWAKFWKTKWGLKEHVAGHLSNSEVDNRRGNLRVTSVQDNKGDYRCNAKAKYRSVCKGERAEKQ